MVKSKEGSSGIALKAGIWYVVSTVIVRMIAVITTPIFTRVMSKAEYGTVATFTSWYALLSVFCSINLTYSIGRAKLDFPGHLDEYIGSMQLLSLGATGLLCAVCAVFLDPVVELAGMSRTAVILLLVYLLCSPVISFVQNGNRYRYQYRQNIAIAVYIAVSTVILSLGLIFLLPGDKAVLRMIGIVVPNLVLGIYFWIRSLRSGWVRARTDYWKYGFRLSAPMVLHTVSLHILAQSDRIFITKLCGADMTALYSLTYSYGMMVSALLGAMGDGWLPWFHDSYFNGQYGSIRENAKYMVILCCYIGMACIAFAPEVIRLLGGAEYEGGIGCVLPIALGIVCQQVYTHYVNIELHLKKTDYVSSGTVFAAVLNLVLNAVFIPRYGYAAAAYTTLASYFALLVIHFFITRYLLKVRLYQDRFMFGSLLVTAAVSFMITRVYRNIPIRYALVAGGFVSFLIVFRKFVLQFLQKKRFFAPAGEGSGKRGTE